MPAQNTTDILIDDRQAGQATVPMILMLLTFLLAVMAFAVDLTNLWFHRAATQTAADAACQAGAMDMLAKASGVTPPAMGFVAGVPSNCVSSSSASICKYSGFNGYTGAGFSSTAASNSVSWTFPGSVSGATAPAVTITAFPFLSVTVEENVKTWFMALLGIKYQAVAASCTCGLSQVLSETPMVVLNPSGSGSLSYSGGAVVTIYGGSQRSIQVNSTSATAVSCSPSGMLNTNLAGPNGTGADVSLSGGPSTPAVSGDACFNGGTTGAWRTPTLPIPDPYASVPAPTLPAASSTASTFHVVTYGQDGCPDHSPTNYVSTVPHSGCDEYEPGYYASGISGSSNDVMILKPGIYYMGASFNLGGSNEVRVATPCVPSCSPYSSTSWQQTDGVMFYFLSGSLNISGGSGALSSGRVDAVNSTALTCNGSAPNAAVGVPSTINGNVLIAQCSTTGTYVGAPSTDTSSSSGSRGLLVFMAHTNTSGVSFSGSGSLAFSGSIYGHNSACPITCQTISVSGGSGTTTFALGEIISDNINLSGSGAIKMQLSSSPSINLVKAGLLQ